MHNDFRKYRQYIFSENFMITKFKVVFVFGKVSAVTRPTNLDKERSVSETAADLHTRGNFLPKVKL